MDKEKLENFGENQVTPWDELKNEQFDGENVERRQRIFEKIKGDAKVRKVFARIAVTAAVAIGVMGGVQHAEAAQERAVVQDYAEMLPEVEEVQEVETPEVVEEKDETVETPKSSLSPDEIRAATPVPDPNPMPMPMLTKDLDPQLHPPSDYYDDAAQAELSRFPKQYSSDKDYRERELNAKLKVNLDRMQAGEQRADGFLDARVQKELRQFPKQYNSDKDYRERELNAKLKVNLDEKTWIEGNSPKHYNSDRDWRERVRNKKLADNLVKIRAEEWRAEHPEETPIPESPMPPDMGQKDPYDDPVYDYGSAMEQEYNNRTDDDGPNSSQDRERQEQRERNSEPEGGGHSHHSEDDFPGV